MASGGVSHATVGGRSGHQGRAGKEQTEKNFDKLSLDDGAKAKRVKQKQKTKKKEK